MIACLETIGPGAHVMAICQPTVAALAAVSLMAADDHPAQPASMTLMAGPLDTRVNPTSVNHLAKSKPIEWFEEKLISVVPAGFAGAHRRVYPGFVQLSAFMAMNLQRHRDSLGDMYRERIKGDPEKAKAVRVFYEEYFATMDLSAEFYLETVETIFQKHALPLGELTVFGRKGRSFADSPYRAVDGRGRKGRYLRGRSDARGARHVQPSAPLYEKPSCANGCRPLRRV